MKKEYINLDFKDEVELLAECERVISESDVLDSILREIKTLKRGEVRPESTLKRSEIGSYFSSEIQQISNYIYNRGIAIDGEIRTKLSDIASKADAVLRENIVLQSKPSLDVIKFKNVPVRYAHSLTGGKEQRWGYGLHKLPMTEMGYSITGATMPPKYIQSYHNHTISEYTLPLDKKISIVNIGKEKEYAVNPNEIAYFSPTAPHTIYNPANSPSRNISVKIPIGLIDWKSLYDLHPIKSTHSEVLKGKLSRLDGVGGTKISFSIKDEYYNYKLEILELKKASVMERIYDKDKYFFVIDGELLISSGDIKKQCARNDYIVIDKDTNFKIKTRTKSRLYTVNPS